MEIKKTEDRYIIKNINTIGENPFYLKISKNELLELRNLIDKIFLDEKKPLKK